MRPAPLFVSVPVALSEVLCALISPVLAMWRAVRSSVVSASNLPALVKSPDAAEVAALPVPSAIRGAPSLAIWLPASLERLPA